MDRCRGPPTTPSLSRRRRERRGRSAGSCASENLLVEASADRDDAALFERAEDRGERPDVGDGVIQAVADGPGVQDAVAEGLDLEPVGVDERKALDDWLDAAGEDVVLAVVPQ